MAGIVILASWCIAILFRFGPFDNPMSWYLMRLADCLIVVLPIPTVTIGLWSSRGLTRRDHSQDIGYAVFGIIAGLLSIVAALFILL